MYVPEIGNALECTYVFISFLKETGNINLTNADSRF